MTSERLSAALLLIAALLGLCGGWSLLPSPALFLVLTLLGGHIAVAILVPQADSPEPCWLAGPGRLAVDFCASLLLVVPAVLPLYFLSAGLDATRWTLPLIYMLLAAVVLLRGQNSTNTSYDDSDRAASWGVWAVAVLLLLPAVLRFAGGTVDDWWDLSFVRAYADRETFSFDEAVLGSLRVHPRFAWNSWLLLQAIARVFGASPIEVQQSRLAAPLVCILVVSATTLLAGSVFGRRRRTARFASVLLLPLWLWGTEALPFFTRLHQDKFVAGLVVLPVVLAATVQLWLAREKRAVVWFGLALGACATIHGLIVAIALLGACAVTIACLAALPAEREPAVRRLPPLTGKLAWALFVIAAAIAYPLWQAIAVKSWFASEGISLAIADNPVVRAHLALDRLLWPTTRWAIVRPSAVFAPIAVLAVPALFCAWRRRSQLSARVLLTLSAVPCLLLFVPPLSSAAGALLVPWMLYRVGWLVPMPLLFGATAEFVLAQRGWRRLGSLALLLAVAAALSAPVVSGRLAREMRPHPLAWRSEPAGATLGLYRFLAARKPQGPVIAAAGLSNLIPAMTGHPVLAMSERATLVFSGSERQAYQRLYDRARFLSRGADAAARAQIARRYGARYAVFRRRYVVRGTESAWADGTDALTWRSWLQAGALPTWAAKDDDLHRAIPEGWQTVYRDRDFVVVGMDVLSAPATVTTATATLTQRPSWLVPFAASRRSAAPPGTTVLASAAAYPGARYRFDPTPASAGTSRGPSWNAGGLFWGDGPSEVRVEVELEHACGVTGVELVPSLPSGRREVLELSSEGRSVRVRAHDEIPIYLELAPRPRRRVVVRIRSLMGLPFSLVDLRVLGHEQSCRPSWFPLMHPQWALPQVPMSEWIEQLRSYPNQARQAEQAARLRQAAGAGADAAAILRLALQRQANRPHTWIELGLLEQSIGRSESATRRFRKALAQDAASAWARGCLAWAELRRGALVAALWHDVQALQAEPQYADAYTILGLAMRRLSLDSLARRFLTRAVRLDPRRDWGVLELSKLLLASGDRDAAARSLREYLRLVPDDRRAAALLGRVGSGPAALGADGR